MESWMQNGRLVELSIIVPCLNENDNLPIILPKLANLILANSLNAELVILDDASTDDTYRLAERIMSQHTEIKWSLYQRHEPRRGYGAIMRFGLAHAIGRYAIPVSADDVDPIDVIPVFLEHMRNGADLVQCSRYSRPKDAETIPFKYKFYQTIYRALVKFLIGQEIRDSTYSFKMHNRILMMAVGLSSNRFSISPEITFKTLLTGGKIVYVPGSQGVRIYGISKFKFLREGPGFAWVLFRAALHRLGILWF
ncbi:MAG: glycosyltransferase family 2 protein [Candidatus Aminicenantes bacterium]|nr:glycosyltransferase family 2 protein [Candidatus Aminicenantes bacterium]